MDGAASGSRSIKSALTAVDPAARPRNFSRDKRRYAARATKCAPGSDSAFDRKMFPLSLSRFLFRFACFMHAPGGAFSESLDDRVLGKRRIIRFYALVKVRIKEAAARRDESLKSDGTRPGRRDSHGKTLRETRQLITIYDAPFSRGLITLLRRLVIRA